MDAQGKNINAFLVETFHDILKIEETALGNSTDGDLSIKEFHLLKTVSELCRDKGDNTAGNVAIALRVTPGTLTTAVKNLEKKGYLKREKSKEDRRSVHIIPTKKGQKATEKHDRFHDEMVSAITSSLNEEEALTFVKGLRSLVDFFNRKDKNRNL